MTEIVEVARSKLHRTVKSEIEDDPGSMLSLDRSDLAHGAEQRDGRSAPAFQPVGAIGCAAHPTRNREQDSNARRAQAAIKRLESAQRHGRRHPGQYHARKL